MAKNPKENDTYSESETARRRDATIRNMIATPPKPNVAPKKKRAKTARKNRKKSTD